MADEKGRYRDPTAVLKEIEDEIERLKSGRKELIEKKLQEKILREQSEAAAEISRVEKEFQQEREGLKKYEEVIADYDGARAELQNRIREHLGRVEQCKAEIAGSALSAATSLREVDRQYNKFRDLRRIVEERATLLKNEIAEKYDMTVQLPERLDSDELKVDINKEIAWFQRIIQDLEGRPAAPPSRPEPRPEARVEAKPQPRPEARPEPRIEPRPAPRPAPQAVPPPELKIVPAPASARAAEPARPEPRKIVPPPAPAPPPPAPSRPAQAVKPSPDAAFEQLRAHMRYDPTDHAGEMRFFQKDDKIILDSEFIIGAMRDALDATRTLYERMGQTRISKDQFFIKQEIVNRQEALRKVVLRGVRMCEDEECQLPAFTLDIVNPAILKNILEMLNVGNWSSEEDFRYFVRYADRVRSAYYARITPPAAYYAAILTELGS